MKIIGLLVSAVCSYLCYNLAKKSGKNAILAAVLGFIFSIISLIVYFLLSRKK